MMRRHVTTMPERAELHNNYGVMLGQMGRREEALSCFKQAIRLKPDYAAAYGNQGAALEEMQHYSEALESYLQAIRLSPNYAEAHQNLSNVLRKLHRPLEAITAAKEAIRLRGNYSQALNSLGSALLENAQPQEAQTAFERAIKLNPNLGDIHANLAAALLMQGKYEQGWSEYSWRTNGKKMTHVPQPWGLWRTMDLRGRTVLIRAEGGAGHVIHFARYLPMIAKRGAKVFVQCQTPLVPLVRTVPGIQDAFAKGKARASAEFRIPQRCLPQLFGTTLDTIPLDLPYLRPPQGLVQKWWVQMQPVSGVRVGVCWQGSQGNLHMRDRSFDSQLLAPLAEIPNVTLVNLQVGAKPSPDVRMVHVPGYDYERGDFLGLAAIVKNLDLVIACDTSIAHVAGALGMPTWVAVRFASEWRYMLNRDTCPWYPTMRLFRQPQIGDWKAVFGAMAESLTSVVQSNSQLLHSIPINDLSELPFGD